MTVFGFHSESTSAARQRIEAAGRRFMETRSPAADPTLEQRRIKAHARVAALRAAEYAAARDRVLKAYRTIVVIPLPEPFAERIIGEVCDQHHITKLEIKSPRRNVNIVRARHEAVWRLKNETSLSYPQIGRLFGLDPTSVCYAVRRHNGMLTGKPYYKVGTANKEPA